MMAGILLMTAALWRDWYGENVRMMLGTATIFDGVIMVG